MSDRELKLHAVVSELLAHLGLDEEPEKCLDMLSKGKAYATPMKNRQETTQALAERIAVKAADLSLQAPDRFISLYERLRLTHNRELEPLLYILNKVQTDPNVAAALATNSHVQQRLRPTVSTGSIKDLAGTPRNATPVKASGLHRTRLMDESYRPSPLSKSRSFNLATLLATESPSQSSIYERVKDDSTLTSNAKATPMKAKVKVDGVKEKLLGLKAPLEKTFRQSDADHVPDSTLNMGDYSVFEQEALVIEDLLYVLLGMDGEVIRRIEEKGSNLESPSFTIDASLETSIADMVSKILPLAGFYHMIEAFIETYSAFKYGRVFHALCAAMDALLQEYRIMVGQLEQMAHEGVKFTLQKMWFYVAPSLDVMGNVAALASTITERTSATKTSIDDYDARFFAEGGSDSNRDSGMLLTILSKRMVALSGNQEAAKLQGFLLSKASAPYMQTLSTWITTGQLDDPFNEFMVEERSYLSKDKLKEDFNDVYWEQRYTLRDDAIPEFLEPWKDKILLAGKYLNVLRECGIDIRKTGDHSSLVTKSIHSNVDDVAKAVDDGRFIISIEQAYLFANKSLIDLLFKNHKLLDRLRSLKRFFLLEQSDYLTHFLDLAISDLMKPASEVPLEKVRSLLELVIRSPSSCCSSDEFKADVTVELHPMTLFQQLLKISSMVGVDMKKHLQNLRSGRSFDINESLAENALDDPSTLGGLAGSSAPPTGIEALMIGHSVNFPISLIINKKMVTKYQLIFRKLFLCKYLERLLYATWLDQTKLQSELHKAAPSKSTLSNNRLEEMKMLGRMSLLREKMLHFIQMFMYYVFFEVLEPNWNAFELQLQKASTVDEILASHDDFLNSCLKECMLTNPKLIKLFSGLVNTCHDFVQFSDSYAKSQVDRVSIPKSTSSDNLSTDAMDHIPHMTQFEHSVGSDDATLRKLEDVFLRQMLRLMDSLQVLGVSETPRLSHLLSQLDYNSFYHH